MTFDLARFRQSKAYDLLMGSPLIAWFVYVMIGLRAELGRDARAVLEDPGSLAANLRFYAYFAAAAFAFMNIYLIVMRTTPVLRSRGFLPKLFAIAGTFLGVGINYLKPVPLSLGWQAVALVLILVGSTGSVVAIGNLGKSFSIMPEARKLVTTGPYGFARHPLYAAEMFSVAGTAVLYQQPWAALLAVAVLVLLVIRSHFEERILLEAYPEYADYRKRVKRFGFV
ncbi:MAG TPA: isoprenylcysteine carboxylmethyltransferase family protein [Rhizomicrobium sp.]|nr:isoprenylcysteine carboxylmethyltransferase family protein [Rhizomicrobium sp.]